MNDSVMRRLNETLQGMVVCWWNTIFFFFNDPAPTEIYTLPLHDALPIFARLRAATIRGVRRNQIRLDPGGPQYRSRFFDLRSEEHTSELQSPCNLVCRLLLEKKNESL